MDALEFLDFLQHPFQAEGTGILFERIQSRLGTWQDWFRWDFCCPFVTGCARTSRWGFFPCLGDHNGEQRIELRACLHREMLHDGDTEPLVKAVDGGMHEAAHAIRCWRVNQLLFATGIERGDKGFLLP